MFNTLLNNSQDTTGVILLDCVTVNFRFMIELRVNEQPLGLISEGLLCFALCKRVCFNREQFSNDVPPIW